MSRLASACFVLEGLSLSSVQALLILLRLGRLESSLSVFERTVVGGNVFVLNAAHTASTVSVRSFARLGSSASLLIEQFPRKWSVQLLARLFTFCAQFCLVRKQSFHVWPSMTGWNCLNYLRD